MSQYDQPKLLALLEDLERAGTYSHEDDNAGESCCPSCGKCTGHDETCELAAALVALRNDARTDYVPVNREALLDKIRERAEMIRDQAAYGQDGILGVARGASMFAFERSKEIMRLIDDRDSANPKADR